MFMKDTLSFWMDDLEVINRLSNKKNIIPKYLDDDILEYVK